MKKTMKNTSKEERKIVKELRKIYGHKSPAITRRYIGQDAKTFSIAAHNMPENIARRYYGVERAEKSAPMSLEVMRRYCGIDEP